MNDKVTKKEVRSRFMTIIDAGNGYIWYMLDPFKRFGHTERAEGWGCDVYAFSNVAITTGDAPFGNVKADYDLCRKYNQVAKGIYDSYCRNEISYDEEQRRMHGLVMDFIGDVRETSEK